MGTDEQVGRVFDMCAEILRHVCDFEGCVPTRPHSPLDSRAHSWLLGPVACREAPKDQEHLCVSTVELMVTLVLPAFERVTDTQRQALLELLFSGSHYDVRSGSGSGSREQLAQACLRGLFTLCQAEDRPGMCDRSPVD